jgi:translation initiation factor 2 subunit 1
MLYRREGFPESDELVLSTVTKVLPHVVFVNLDEYDRGGLVHISEIAPGRIRNIREYVELGKKIVCKVLRIDREKGHIDLSLRRVSEMEKKKKVEAIKQEQKAEKVIEMVALQLKKKTHDVYETLTAQVFQRYSFVHLFFKDIAIGKAKASDLIQDKAMADVFQPIVMERFKPAKVNIKGSLIIKSYESNGVEVVKEIVGKIEQKKKNSATLSIVYSGGGKYRTTIEAGNYKDAEKTVASIEDFVEGVKKAEAAFERDEE